MFIWALPFWSSFRLLWLCLTISLLVGGVNTGLSVRVVYLGYPVSWTILLGVHRHTWAKEVLCSPLYPRLCYGSKETHTSDLSRCLWQVISYSLYGIWNKGVFVPTSDWYYSSWIHGMCPTNVSPFTIWIHIQCDLLPVTHMGLVFRVQSTV